MAYIFGDSFDLYTTVSDPLAGYWDSGPGSTGLATGRFASSQAIQFSGLVLAALVKNSGANDAVHHINCAIRFGSSFSVTSPLSFFQLSDGATNQVCIVFRSDGTILLTSATSAGTTLATYTGAITTPLIWFTFEFEIIIHPTAGRFRARRNGNTSDDFDSGATLNTRPGANSYANKLTLGMGTGGFVQQIDDLLWRSDTSSVAWVGDVRCYSRMPVSDQSVQFARAPALQTQSVVAGGSQATVVGTARYCNPFTAPYDGTIGSVTATLTAGYTGNMKCSLFSANSAAINTPPAAVLGSATPIVNPVTGVNTFTFPTPVAVTKGQFYIVGFITDAATGTLSTGGVSSGMTGTGVSYASFPQAGPAIVNSQQAVTCTVNITLTANNQFVSEAQQDGTSTYVYDSTVNHADFYGLGTLGATPPSSIIMLTTRGFIEKSDAGARSGAMQLKSGTTTVSAPTLTLATGFQWNWRNDIVDPNTGSAWTTANADATQIGPLVVS